MKREGEHARANLAAEDQVTLYESFVQARRALVAAGISEHTATLDADLLARHALGWDRARWLSRRAEPADAAFIQRYAALLARRTTREPVAYIRGVQEFWGRDFAVTRAVLIPRPETELAIEVALPLIASRNRPIVADIGTGSGCIAVTLALECPNAEVWATDVSREALAVARGNAADHGVADRVRFVEGAYLAGTPPRVDVIVSNPPYVAAPDKPGLAPEVREFEPAVALFGGDDGLRDVRGILRQSVGALADDGRLVMEIGYGQGARAEAEVACVDGLAVEALRSDLQGIPRVLVVRRAA